MTALQIARDHCANWLGDGKGCLGAMIDDDLQIRRCCPKPKCVVGRPGQRCLYFEECVAPMMRSIENARLREDFTAAVREYRRAANLPAREERCCRICNRPLQARQRFCRLCAAARHRLNRREWAREKRQEASKINGLTGVAAQEVAEVVCGGWV